MKRRRSARGGFAAALAPLLLALLAACGGGTQGPANLFTEENAWNEPIPAEADIVTPDAFRQGIASGQYELITSAMLAEQAGTREDAFDADVTELKGLPLKSGAVQALLQEVQGVPDYRGGEDVTLPGGDTVTLLGLGEQARELADAEALARDRDNVLADYTLSYELLPSDLQAQLPAPDSLSGASLTQVRAALAQLESLLESSASASLLGAAHAEKGGAVWPQAIVPGNGTDNNGACSPTNLAGQYWFPLKSFLSPMKQQARRGTCWAFTSIGALESREQVQNDSVVNLSEQFLVNKVKQDWDANDYTDGYWAERAMNAAADRNQQFPSEASWTYNPAPSRASSSDGDAAAYGGTCTGYSGTCSPTAHESREVCTTVIFDFCSYATVNFGGPGAAPSRAVQVWKNGDPFDLARYRMLLAQGHVIMASFPVYKGFMDDVGGDGIVSNYARTRLDDTGKEVAGSYGGHAVQIVGFLSNLDLTKAGVTPNIGGGGYFIVKNSWGCGAGDHGYYYVPADYVSSIFNSLSILDFDTRRSQRWISEQNAPGGTVSPTITIKANPGYVDLRVEKDLAQFFSVTHPVAKSVTLEVTSDKDGVLYNGAWSTDPNALFGPQLKRTFATQGVRTLTLRASYGSGVKQANLFVNVINTAPTVTLSYAGTAHVGEAYPITALITDINEASGQALCANTTWQVDAPDALDGATGCARSVTFGTTGSRQVRVHTLDGEGAQGNWTATLDVQPAPVNPYPKITSYGVYGYDYLFFNGQFIGCGDVAVDGGRHDRPPRRRLLPVRHGAEALHRAGDGGEPRQRGPHLRLAHHRDVQRGGPHHQHRVGLGQHGLHAVLAGQRHRRDQRLPHHPHGERARSHAEQEPHGVDREVHLLVDAPQLTGVRPVVSGPGRRAGRASPSRVAGSIACSPAGPPDREDSMERRLDGHI